MVSVIMQCHYAKCRYAECRGALESATSDAKRNPPVAFTLKRHGLVNVQIYYKTSWISKCTDRFTIKHYGLVNNVQIHYKTLWTRK